MGRDRLGRYTVKYHVSRAFGGLLSGTLEIVNVISTVLYVENHPAPKTKTEKKWLDADYHPSVGGGVNQRTKCVYLLLVLQIEHF